MSWECSKCGDHVMKCRCRRKELSFPFIPSSEFVYMTEFGSTEPVRFLDVSPIQKTEHRLAKHLRKVLHLDCEDKVNQWISVKNELPRKDIPILVVTEYCEIPDVVKWQEDGTYGYPGFFESNNEYETKEKDITHWMPCPELPKE